MIEEDKLNALELFGENEYLHKEIERLNNIIKEVREYIDKWKFEVAGNGACMEYEDIQDIVHILDKENK